MENNNGKGIFYGVIGVATLVVAIIGATFAYFASATQGNNGAAAANSAKVDGTLAITQDGQYVASDLIPAGPKTVLASFGQPVPADPKKPANTDKCRGASAANKNGNYGICSYYTFTVTNSSDVATTVYLSLKTDANGFDDSFKYCVYEGTTTDKTTQACKSAPAEGTADQQFTSVSLAAGAHQQYTMILYYENTDTDQTKAGAGKSYTGTVKASTSDGKNQIVGYIAGVQEDPGV